MLVFTNINVFFSSFRGLFSPQIHATTGIQTSDTTTNNQISSAVQTNAEQDAKIQALLADSKSWTVAISQEDVLSSHLDTYPFQFNTLPPVNILIIPSLWLEIPVIDSTHKEVTDFIKGNFDDELTKGVVKYPTTPEPGTKGNTLIFGHTSQERWKHNTYGTIFKDIPKLVIGDTIQVVRKENLYTYKVVDKFVVLPKQVNAQYLSYENAWDSYLTLMGCYPIGTDKERVMVVAKLSGG